MSTVRRHLGIVVVGVMAALLSLQSAAAAQPAAGFGTDARTLEGEGPEQITVTDLQVASSAGVDRVTFEITGNGLAGARVFYDDNPAEAGIGTPVELAGDATLQVAITNALFPPDAPEGVASFEDNVAGPEGGVVTEIFNDLWFEGDHTFFVGVTQELPFRVQRLDDPQRIVVDIASDTPVGGVATGLGGTAADGPALTPLAASLAVALAVAFGVARRVRRHGTRAT